jgi:hypothetical protein
MEKWKFITLPGLELRRLGHPVYTIESVRSLSISAQPFIIPFHILHFWCCPIKLLGSKCYGPTYEAGQQFEVPGPTGQQLICVMAFETCVMNKWQTLRFERLQHQRRRMDAAVLTVNHPPFHLKLDLQHACWHHYAGAFASESLRMTVSTAKLYLVLKTHLTTYL